MPLTVDTLPSRSDLEWDKFVLSHPNATLSHLAAWRRVIENAYRLPSTYLVVKRGQETLGVLPLVHMKGLLAPNRLVSMPFLDQGGVLSASHEASRALLDSASQLAQSLGARGLDLRAPLPHLNRPPSASSRVRFLLSLPDNENELWQSLGPKVRNQIRKAEKEGLRTKPVEASNLGAFFRIFSQNMRDLGSPTHSLRFFERLAVELSNQFQLYLTCDDKNTVVAGGIAIQFRNVVSMPWASSLRSARRLCPNHSLYWRILQDSRDSGAGGFDFGRSSIGTGTYRFKKQWNAKAIPLEWIFLDPLQAPQSDYYLGAGNHSVATRIWSHLPLQLTLALGPQIRRQLPN